MGRFRFQIVPYIEQLPYWLVDGLDRWMIHGRIWPLCLATVVAYLFVVSRR